MSRKVHPISLKRLIDNSTKVDGYLIDFLENDVNPILNEVKDE